MLKNSFCFQKRLHFSWQYKLFWGRSHISPLQECVVFRMQNKEQTARLGITIKARSCSVNRNAVKRQIRETFRLHCTNLGYFDYHVVIPFKKDISYPYSKKLRSCLERHFLHASSSRSCP